MTLEVYMNSYDTTGKATYTTEEIAKRHSVHRSTVYRWLDAGILKSIKIGRCRRITVEQEKEFLNSFL
jgi:excisionase family DNA binding protein